MKKILSLLALVLMSCMGAWAEEIRPTYVSSNTTKGANDGEHASKLVDATGQTTKWGESFTNGTTELWIIVQADNTILKSYTLTNGNDTHTYPGRRWASWTVEGSNSSDANGTWTEIDAQTDATVNYNVQYASTTFSTSGNTSTYSYYKITLTKINGTGQHADMQQMGDLKFNVDRGGTVTIPNGIYEIKNASNEGGVGRGYLIDYTSYTDGPSIGNCQWTTASYNTKHPSNHNDGTSTCSYWYVHNGLEGVYIFSLSSLSENDYPKFLNVSATGSWNDSKVALDIDANTSFQGTYSIRNHGGGDNEYLSMACGTNSTEGAIKRNGMSDGGDALSFISIQESALNDDQRYIMNYGISLIAGTAPELRISNKKVHSFHINCDGTPANYLNPFTFPTQTENQRGVYQFYRVGETAKVKIKEVGSGKYLSYSANNEGKNKIALVAEVNASEFIVGKNVSGTTITYAISPATNTTQGFNWHGGVNESGSPYQINADNPTVGMGFYSVSNGNSKWQLHELTGDAATTAISNSATYYLNILKHNALALNSTIGEGLGNYNFNSGNVTGFEDAVNACADENALTSLTNSLRLNMPEAGSFLRIKASTTNKSGYSIGTTQEIYLAAENSTSNTGREAFVLSEGANNNANTLFYYTGERLVAYSNGMIPTMSSSMLKLGSVGDNGVDITFEEIGRPVEVGAYRIEFNNGGRSLYTQRATTDGQTYYFTDAAGGNQTDAHYRYFLEEVTELPVTFGATKFSTFYTPSAVAVPTGVTAYVCNLNGEDLKVYTCKQTINIEGTEYKVIPANTAVMLKADEATTYNFMLLSDDTAEAYDNNSFFGDVVTKPFAEDYTYYSLQRDNTANDGTVGFFIKPSGNFQGFRAFLKTPTSQASNRLNIHFEGDEVLTDIIEALGLENAIIPAYDLSGRRVNAHSSNGFYIVNGKKIIK